jgi:hypothetical protein
MFSIKSFFIAAVIFSAIIFSTSFAKEKSSADTSKTKSDLWVPVDESDWAVYMEAPDYHFALAKEYLQKGDYVKASSELKIGNSFLVFQKNRLSAASKQIEKLLKSIEAGKEKDINKLDAVTSNALKVIDHRYAEVPVEVGETSVFEEAYNYHFDKAKVKLLEKDSAGSASEIRKAASFLRLTAAHTGHMIKAEIDAAGSELKELASKVESGTVKDVKELDRVFQKAILAVSKKKK